MYNEPLNILDSRVLTCTTTPYPWPRQRNPR